MILRLINSGATLFVYFRAATLLAELIILGYLWSVWQLDRDRLVQAVASCRGDVDRWTDSGC